MSWNFPDTPTPGQVFEPVVGVFYVWQDPVWKRYIPPTDDEEAGIEEAPIDGLTYGRKDADWSTIVGGAVISEGPPAPPLIPGQLWYEADSGNTYIWYEDADSAQWVQVNVQPPPAQNAIPEMIASGPADMAAGFKTSGNRFVVNDKADFSGANVFSVSEAGAVNASSVTASGAVDAGTVAASGNMVASQFRAVNYTVSPGGVIGTDTANGYVILSSAIGNIAGTIYLRPNGCNNSAGAASITSAGHLNISGLAAPAAYQGRAGEGGGVGQSFNYYWTSTVMNAYVGTVYVGYVSLVSDYRTKKDVVDLSSTWEQVKALRPVKYTQAEFTPPMSDEVKARQGEQPETPPPLFTADNVERWGFIAHELQETLVHSAATGEKDMEDGVQAPVWTAILAATVKALQEAMARIEALEAANGL